MVNLIEMFRDRSGFVTSDCVNVFVNTFLKFSFRFPNILFSTFLASDYVNYVPGITRNFTNDIMDFTRDGASDCIVFCNKLALVAVVTTFSFACSGLMRLFGYICFDKNFSQIWWLSKGRDWYI